MQIKTSTTENEFINNYVLNTFRGSKKHNLNLAIYSTSGQIMFATDIFCKEHDAINIEEINKNIADASTEHSHIYHQIIEIQQSIIADHLEICYLFLVNTKKQQYDYRIVRHWPIFMPNGKVAGSIEIIYPSNIISHNIADLISNKQNMQQGDENNHLNVDKFNLSNRQHEILFLLSHGATQSDIADLLCISRGCVSKTIARDINPKFNIQGASAHYLVDKIKQIHLNISVPDMFKNHRIIILESISVE